MLSPRIIPSSTYHVGSNCHKWSKRLNFTSGLHFYLILLHSINSVLWHMAFWKALFPQDHIPSALCFSCWCRALCWETKVFSVLLTLPSVKANHVVAIILAPCTYLPFFAHPMHIPTTYYLDADHRKERGRIPPFSAGIALVRFMQRKRDRSPSRCWVWWRGMQVVLLEHWSYSLVSEHVLSPHSCSGRESMMQVALAYHMQQEDLVPCGRGDHRGGLCPGTVWYSSCAHMLTWSWRPCGCLLTGLAPVRLFWWGWGDCNATDSGMSTVGSVSEIPAPRSRTWHRHTSSLRICTSALGWLACWVGAGVPVWCFPDRCNFILRCELAGHQPAPSQEQIIRLDCAPC